MGSSIKCGAANTDFIPPLRAIRCAGDNLSCAASLPSYRCAPRTFGLAQAPRLAVLS
jgi:hypothetical protein